MSTGTGMMIRRGSLKYVFCEADPPQLYDLAIDPDELVNLCTLTEHADTVAAFEAEVHKRWRPAEIKAAVIASQHARRTVDTALRKGRHVSWDHQPFEDSSNQYMRNHLDLNEVERISRFPRATPVPDHFLDPDAAPDVGPFDAAAGGIQ